MVAPALGRGRALEAGLGLGPECHPGHTRDRRDADGTPRDIHGSSNSSSNRSSHRLSHRSSNRRSTMSSHVSSVHTGFTMSVYSPGRETPVASPLDTYLHVQLKTLVGKMPSWTRSALHVRRPPHDGHEQLFPRTVQVLSRG